MINAIVGRPRSGKSYEAVAFHIIPAVKSGRKVITNIPLNLSHFAAVYGDECLALIDVRAFDFAAYGDLRPFSTVAEYMDDWRNDKGQGPLYVIDEAHLCLPRVRTPVAVTEWYSMHGHYGVDIILLTQNIRKVDRDIQDMCELVYYCGKLTALGLEDRYSRKVRGGVSGEVLNEETRTYNASYFPFYKSHTQSKDAVVEASAQDVKPIWHHWTFKGAALMFSIAVLLACWGLFGGDDPEPVPVVQQAPDAKLIWEDLSSSPGSSNVIGSPVAIEELKPELPASKKPHPYSAVELYVAAVIRNSSKKIALFRAAQNGQEVFQLTASALVDAGYTVEIVSDCLVHLSYNEYQDYITCNLPKVGPRIGGS